jgi:GNAT superfamily N-acetyltransferase
VPHRIVFGQTGFCGHEVTLWSLPQELTGHDTSDVEHRDRIVRIMARVVVALPNDFSAWLILAAEVEALLGPMVDAPTFQRALHKHIGRGTAFCVRESDGPPGAPLMGGLLFSPGPPVYRIGWLAVARRHRRQGIARSLVEHILGLAVAPAEFAVTTFGGDNPEGEPARRFYERMGFHAAEGAPNGPEGGSRQVFRRAVS